MRTTTARPAQVPDGFWQRPDVTAALLAHDIGALFRLIRQHTGLSQHRIGAAVDLTQGDVSRIMRAGPNQRHVTTYALILRIAAGLNMPDHTRAALGLAPREPAPPVEAPRQPVRGSSTSTPPKVSTPSKTPNHALSRLINEAGLSRAELARRVNELGDPLELDLDYDYSSVYRWTSKGERPRNPAPRLIAAVLSKALRRPMTIEDIGMADSEPSRLNANADANTPVFAASNRVDMPTQALQSASAESEEDSLHRRTVLYGFVGAVGALGSATAIGSDRLEALRRNLDGGLNASTSTSDVDEWERVAYQYAHDVGLLPPDKVLPELLTDLDEIQARLSTTSGRMHTGLAHACSQLSALVAIALLNLDEALSSRRYWRTAIRAADQTPDQPLQALIRGRRAVFALYDQRSATTVLTLADEAIAAASGTACAGAASGYAARAQALALLGQHSEARDALDRLTLTFAKLPEATVTDRGSQWGWSEQRLRHVESHVYSYAGDIKNATKAQDQARSLYPSQLYQGRTQIELHRAICLINSGDPSEGARHTVRTLAALPATARRDALLRRTAAFTLDFIPDGAARLPAVSEARELLGLPVGPA
jgi:Helix-turn-helix domain